MFDDGFFIRLELFWNIMNGLDTSSRSEMDMLSRLFIYHLTILLDLSSLFKLGYNEINWIFLWFYIYVSSFLENFIQWDDNKNEDYTLVYT